mmetsp:Transcript_64836/g.154796  ORF Transcript_64836/g.154796 Transcript_64836/m.154796 type:complete len:405 (+) Transcript_64836:66-1280(+)
MPAVRVLVAGAPEFQVQLEQDATVADVKIAATSGCDIDPEIMRIIFKGKVLGDSDLLEASGVQNMDPLHIARGRPTSAAVAGSSAPAAAQSGAPPAQDASSLCICVRGIGGLDTSIQDLKPGDLVAKVRGLVAELCSMEAGAIHLIFKGRILKDTETLESNSIVDGSVLRCAKRSAATSDSFPQADVGTSEATATAEEGMMGSAMPMAWDGNAAQQIQQLGQALFANMAGQQQPPAELQEVLQGLAGSPEGRLAAQQALAAIARQHAAPPQARNDYHARLEQEVRLMQREVRAMIEEQQGSDLEVDEELLADVARTMAEARARGAPVPNASAFVERALARARQRREREARFAREASGLDPDLEDALADAEQRQAAEARWPRRLGSAPQGPAPGSTGSTERSGAQ